MFPRPTARCSPDRTSRTHSAPLGWSPCRLRRLVAGGSLCSSCTTCSFLLSLTICLVSQELRSFASGDASQAGTALPVLVPTSATIVLQPGLRGNARRVTCESTASQLGSSWVGILRVGWCEGVSHVLESRADAALLARSVTSGCECNH